MKVVVGMSQDGNQMNFYFKRKLTVFVLFFLKETLDLMDNEGKLKELSMHFDDYATQFLTARSTYYVLKVESKHNHCLYEFILNVKKTRL
jgi:hypothetical protein